MKKMLFKVMEPGDAWEETNNIYCHSPNFDIRCIYCGGEENSEMVLRHSGFLFEGRASPM